MIKPGSRVQSAKGHGTVLQPSEGRKGYALVDFDKGCPMWVAVSELVESSVAAPVRGRKGR
jgi:hypothetical protein